jgi:hypothetical protein
VLHHVLCSADKPGSEEPHYHLQQEERVVVKQGKLGYFIGHQTHVQSAEAEEEVVVKPGEGPLLFFSIFFVPMHCWAWGPSGV